MEKVLKCPICGHEAVLHSEYMMKDGHGYDATRYYYACYCCDLIHAASGHTIECSDDKAISDAAKYWNKEVEKIIALMLDNPAISYKCK